IAIVSSTVKNSRQCVHRPPCCLRSFPRVVSSPRSFPRRVPQELQWPSYGLTPLRRVTCRVTGVLLCHLSVWVCPSTLPCVLLPSGWQYCCPTQSALFLE